MNRALLLVLVLVLSFADCLLAESLTETYTLSDFNTASEAIIDAYSYNSTEVYTQAETDAIVLPLAEMNPGPITDPNVRVSSGRTITWDQFTLYYNGAIVTIPVSTASATDNAVSYLSWPLTGTALSIVSSPPEYDAGICIGMAACQSNEVLDIHTAWTLKKREAQLIHAVAEMFPVRVKDGMNIVPDPDVTSLLDVMLNAGEYYTGLQCVEEVSTLYQRTTPARVWYRIAGGTVWTYTTSTTVDPNRYDTGNGIGTLAANKYTKRLFMYSAYNNLINIILPTVSYNTLAQALAAPLPAIPPGLASSPPCTSLTIISGATTLPDATSNQWIDERYARGSNPGTVVNHSSLNGLLNDDHTQYLTTARGITLIDAYSYNSTEVYTKAQTDATIEAFTYSQSTIDGMIRTDAEIEGVIDAYSYNSTEVFSKPETYVTYPTVKNGWDASAGLPGSPVNGDRWLCSTAGNGWTKGYIYQYVTDTWVEKPTRNFDSVNFQSAAFGIQLTAQWYIIYTVVPNSVLAMNTFLDVYNKATINGLTLNSLSNVDVSGPTDNDVLAYDAGTGTWTSEAAASSPVVSGSGTGSIKNNNCTAAGDYTVALGNSASASGQYGLAVGIASLASNIGTVALGYSPSATGQYAIALGNSAGATGNYSMAAGGYDPTAAGDYALSFGSYSVARSDKSIALNRITVGTSDSDAQYSVGIGLDNTSRTVTQPNTLAIMGGKVGIANLTPAVELDVTGKVRSTTFEINDSNTTIDEDVSGNLTFTDAVTGAKTLAELAAGGGAAIWEKNGTVIRTTDETVVYATDDFVYGSPQLDDDANADHDARFFFDKSKGAFRAGVVTGTEWDDASRGSYSFAAGYLTKANGNWGSVATGNGSIASGQSAIALGDYCTASGSYAFAAGSFSQATQTGTIALGDHNIASGSYAFAAGKDVTVSGDYSVGFNLDDTSRELSQNNTMAIMGGNVGIGTVAPGHALSISDATGVTEKAMSIHNYSNAIGGVAGIRFNTAASNDVSYNKGGLFYERTLSGGRGDFKFCQDAADDSGSVLTSEVVVTIKNSGKVGIGTEDPVTNLEVYNSGTTASVRLSGTGNTIGSLDFWTLEGTPQSNARIRGELDGGNTGGKISFYTSPLSGGTPTTLVENMVIRQNGKVGIGIDPAYDFHVGRSGWNETTISSFYAADSTGYPILTLQKSRNSTIGTYTATQTNSYLGELHFNGVNSSSSPAVGANIFAVQDGSAGATYIPTDLYFRTSSASGLNAYLILDSTGDVYTKDWTDYGPNGEDGSTITGWSSFSNVYIRYKKVGNTVDVYFMVAGDSQTTAASFTLPYTSVNDGIYFGCCLTGAADNGSDLSTAARAVLSPNSTTVNCYSNMALGAWTSTSTKSVYGQFSYECQ